MKNMLFALKIGGGEMLVRRKVWAVLLATVLLATFMSAIPALAAGCPPGTIDISNPTNWGNETVNPDIPIANGASALAAGTVRVSGTYCVPTTGYVLGTAAGEDTVTVNVPNVTIVGQSPCSEFDINGKTIGITVAAAGTNCTIHNFTMSVVGGGGSAIQVNTSDCIIEGMQFLEGGNAFTTPIIDLVLGQDHLIQENEFVLNTPTATAASVVRLTGGQGARIVDNLVQGDPTFTNVAAFFVENNFASYNDAQIVGNRVNGGIGIFVGPTAAPNSFMNSLIADNTAVTGTDGINLGATPSNTEVSGNQITYGRTIGGGRGLQDAGGSSIEYLSNTILASTAPGSGGGTALWFVSSNAVIDGNIFDSRGDGTPTGLAHGINATNNDAVPPAADDLGATNAELTNNTIRGTAFPGVGIAMWSPVNTKFLVEGNTIRNCSLAGIVATGSNFALPPVFFGGSNHTIRGNMITNTGIDSGPVTAPTVVPFEGTAIASNGNNKIENNTITDVKNGHGIATTGTSDQITGNSITSVSGPFCSGIFGWVTAGNLVIDDNTIQNVTGAAGQGIGVASGSATITNNIIKTIGAGDGILLLGSEVLEPLFLAAVNLGYASAGNATISGNEIEDIANGVGINLSDNDNNTVADNTITSTGMDGILLLAAPNFTSIPNIQQAVAPIWPGGWFLLPGNTTSMNNTLDGNIIVGAGDKSSDVAPVAGVPGGGGNNGTPSKRYAAIRLEGNVDNNDIDENTIEDAGSATYAVGIELLAGGWQNPDRNEIIKNSVMGFETVAETAGKSVGISVLNGEDNLVSGNTVSNSGKLQYGIDIQTGKDMIIRDNWIEGMPEAGLNLSGGSISTPLVVTGNKLVNNARGIWMKHGKANVTSCNLIVGGSEALYVDPIGNADRFTVSGNCIGTCVLIRNMGIGTLDAKNNYWASDPVQGVNVFGKANVGSQKTTCSCTDWKDVLASAATACCGYEAGWNLVSVPITPSSTGTSAVFGQYAAGLREYNTATQKFIKPSTVNWEKGYWLLMTSKQMVCFQGTAVTGEQTITLSKAGWHLIGVPFPCKWENTVVTPGSSLVLGPIGWDALVQDWVVYALDATLYPCLGYWVYTTQSNVKLTFPYPQPGLPGSGTASVLPLSALPNGMTPPLPPGIPGLTYEAVDDLVFTSFPNPVTDVNTVHFQVNSAAEASVEAVKLEIYDASGAVVYTSGEISDTCFDWHTDNSYGDYLPNGVYSYRMYAKVKGQWVVSGVEAVVILR
jgi:parallel beta-helix repeat protein